jgi:hypothetical protein
VAAPVSFVEDGKPLMRFDSRRLGISLPLPDGRAWRIDDHSRPELIATHAPTHSRVLVAVLRTDDLVGRNQCEAIARDRKLVPEGDLTTVEDGASVTQETFDTRVWVALEPGRGPSAPIVGHVLAFGGFLRKCLIFEYSSEVDSASHADVLSARLAFARTRIFGAMTLEPFVPAREAAGSAR